MNQTFARELHDVPGTRTSNVCRGLGCEPQLRVAAATLSCSSPDQITATTVIGILGQDDEPDVDALVADIADEFGLEARIRVHVGSFSVRFSRAVPAVAARQATSVQCEH